MVASVVFAYDEFIIFNIARVHGLDELSNLNAIEVLEEVVVENGILNLLFGSEVELKFQISFHKIKFYSLKIFLEFTD